MGNFEDLKVVIYYLSELTATRLRKYGLCAKCVALNFRDKNLFSFTRQTALTQKTTSAAEIAKAAEQLAKNNYDFETMPPLRTITVSVTNLEKEKDEQIYMFENTKSEKNAALEQNIDKIRKKHGFNILTRGILLENTFFTDKHGNEDEYLPFKR